MNPQTELQKRYPNTERACALYFAFLASIPLRLWTPKSGLCRHHICPKKQFPEYRSASLFPENITVLTAEEHGKAHVLLAQIALEMGCPSPSWIDSQTAEQQCALCSQ